MNLPRILAVTISLLGLGCSLLLDTSDRTQCTTTADCDAKSALRNRVCQDGICVVPTQNPQGVSSDAGAGCVNTEICTRTNSGRAAVCKTAGQPCVTWQIPECPSIGGKWDDPNALVVGSVLPLHIGQGDGTAFEDPYTKRLLRAMDLGIDEIVSKMPGGYLTPSGTKRPLALLHCDSKGDAATAQRVFRHLTDVVGAPAVVVGWDEDLVAIADDARQRQTAIVCSDCLTPFPGPPGLANAWKILPQITRDVPLVAWRVAQLEAAIKQSNSSDIRVALVDEPYRAQTFFADELGRRLTFNGKSPAANGNNFFARTIEDPRKVPAVHFDTLANDLAAFAPHIVIVDMSGNFPRYLLKQIESALAPGAPRPHYVLTQLDYEAAPWDPVVGTDDALRVRISGTRPATSVELTRNIDAFTTNYHRVYGDSPDGTFSGYEAIYTLGYALVTATASPSFDGPRISSSFPTLVSGTKVDVGSAMLDTGLDLLLRRSTIDLRGLDSELDWDLGTHEIATDMSMFCFQRGSDGHLLVGGGGDVRLSAQTGQITGSFSCP